MIETRGLAVWHDGHIGVYIGNSYVIEEFEENFQDDLLRLYLEHRVKEVGANGED